MTGNCLKIFPCISSIRRVMRMGLTGKKHNLDKGKQHLLKNIFDTIMHSWNSKGHRVLQIIFPYERKIRKFTF